MVLKSKTDLMKAMIGKWKGSVRTWLDPASPPQQSMITAEIKVALGGGSVIHGYRSRMGESLANGVAVIGRSLETGRTVLAWIDTFHTGSDMMVLRDDEREVRNGFSLIGAYQAGDTVWGWRTVYRLVARNRLDVEHYNITPAGEESTAVVAHYQREGKRDTGDDQRKTMTKKSAPAKARGPQRSKTGLRDRVGKRKATGNKKK